MATDFLAVQQRLARAIEDRIVSGQYPPHAPLRQDVIAKQFGVSHIPVREAFRELAARGFIDLLPRRGARVAAFSYRDIQDFLEVRILLEVEALRRAIPRMRAENFAAIQCALHIVSQADASSWPDRNWQFHRELYAACHQSMLLHLIEGLHNDARSKRLHRLITQDMTKSNNEHRRLFQLVQQRSVKAACAYLARHIGIRKARLENLLGMKAK